MCWHRSIGDICFQVLAQIGAMLVVFIKHQVKV